MTYLCLRSLGQIYHRLSPAKALAYPLSLFLFLARLLRPSPGYPSLLRPCTLFLAPPLSESPLVAISSLAIPHLLLGLPSPLSSSLQLTCFARRTSAQRLGLHMGILCQLIMSMMVQTFTFMFGMWRMIHASTL
jgi:hypothetical protein